MEYEIGSDENVSTAVIRAVSAVKGRQPLSLPPLMDILDPEALDALFAAQDDGTLRTGGRVSFVYGNCRITVDNGEYLRLDPLTPSSRGVGEREPSPSRSQEQ